MVLDKHLSHEDRMENGSQNNLRKSTLNERLQIPVQQLNQHVVLPRKHCEICGLFFDPKPSLPIYSQVASLDRDDCKNKIGQLLIINRKFCCAMASYQTFLVHINMVLNLEEKMEDIKYYIRYKRLSQPFMLTFQYIGDNTL